MSSSLRIYTTVRLARFAVTRARANLRQFFSNKWFHKRGLAVHPQFTRKLPAVHCCFPGAGAKCAQLDSDAITVAIERKKKEKAHEQANYHGCCSVGLYRSCAVVKPCAAGHAGQSSFRVPSWGHDDASRRISDPASAAFEQSSAADSTHGFVCRNLRAYKRHGEQGKEC